MVLLALAGCSRSNSPGTGGAAGGLLLNEVMSPNKSFGLEDAAGKVVYQPWVEIRNTGPQTVSLAQFTLSDKADKPNKFRFPTGTTVGPGEYRVVFLFDEQDCVDDCFQDLMKCLGGEGIVIAPELVRQCVLDYENSAKGPPALNALLACLAGAAESGDPASLQLCVNEYAACRENCDVSGLVTGFRLSRSGETLFLFGGKGTAVVDRIGVEDQPKGASNGLDPATGAYGVIYQPTPGGPNNPVNVKPPRFHTFPFREQTSDCERKIAVEFIVERDLVSGAPDVAIYCVDLESMDECGCVDLKAMRKCGEPLTEEEIIRAEVALVDSEEVEVVDRRDPADRPVKVSVERLHYAGMLPPAPCGTLRFFQVVISEPALAGTGAPLAVYSPGECMEYGEQPLTVRVSEYQPRNSQFVFEKYRTVVTDGTPQLELIDASVTPDWVEVVNYGDDPVDIGQLALATGGDIEDRDFDSWLFGIEGKGFPKTATDPDGNPIKPQAYVLPPGGHAFVLADGDGGNKRRTYFLADGSIPLAGDTPEGTAYYATHFSLQPDRKPPSAFDEFSLVDSRTHAILDRVILDFSGNSPAFDLQPGLAVGRFEAEGNEPDALQPGTITECATPGGANQLNCDVPPRFEDAVTRDAGAAAACPAANLPVTVRALVNFDQDTPEDGIRVELGWRVDGGDWNVVTPPDLAIVPAEGQGEPAPACTLYTIEGVIPGQGSGAFVEYRLIAQDLVFAAEGKPQGEEVVFDEATAPRISFRYVVDYAAPADRPRINEVLPGNRSIDLPPFDCMPEEERRRPDFAEIFNPGAQDLDLGGYYLTGEGSPGDLIRRGRLWEFPAGTLVPPGGFLTAYFGPPPECLPEEERASYIEVTGFDLAACGEVLYLVAPDDPERGANCVVDGLSWAPGGDAECYDVAFGRVCDGSDNAVQLGAATPGESNVRPPIFHDSFHTDLLSGDANQCVGESSIVQLKTVFFIDQGLSRVYPSAADRVESAVYVVDRGAGDGEEEFVVRRQDLTGLARCAPSSSDQCATPPDGYSNLAVSLLLQPPAGASYGPVIQFRLILKDACGNEVESPAMSIGTKTAEHPDVVINEINRAAPATPGGEARPWIELYNPSAAEVDLSGMYLSDDPWNPRKAKLAAGVAIAPGGFLVVLTGPGESGELPTVNLDWEAAPMDPDALRVQGALFLADSAERGSCVLDALTFDFGEAEPGVSIGRLPDGAAAIETLRGPSPGRSNEAVAATFVRGDADGDLRVTISDMIRSLHILFLGDPRVPECVEALDADDDGAHNATDPIYTGNALFLQGPPIPPPFPEPGLDPTPDEGGTCH